MADLPAAPGRADPALIHRHDLMAALDRAAQKRVTIISAPPAPGKPRCCELGRTSRAGITVPPS